MRFLEKGECIRWLSANGVSVRNDTPSFRGFHKAIEFPIPADSGRKTAISRALISYFDSEDESLLWIHEFGVWPSSEDPNIFAGFRRALVEHRSLADAPGHIFARNDLKAAASLLAMVLYFIWGAVLYSPGKGLAVEIDHDEFIWVSARNKQDANKFADELKGYFGSK